MLPSSIAAASKYSNVTTMWNTVTDYYANTTTITSCPPESTTVVSTTIQNTSETTETVCDKVCQSKKLAESTATVTSKKISTVTSTICDEVCQSKKSASLATSASSSVVEVTKAGQSTTSSKPAIEQVNENGAAKEFVGVGACILGAAALLI